MEGRMKGEMELRNGGKKERREGRREHEWKEEKRVLMEGRREEGREIEEEEKGRTRGRPGGSQEGEGGIGAEAQVCKDAMKNGCSNVSCEMYFSFFFYLVGMFVPFCSRPPSFPLFPPSFPVYLRQLLH